MMLSKSLSGERKPAAQRMAKQLLRGRTLGFELLEARELLTAYFVSQSAGNDTYDGLAAAWDGAHGPWKTLTKASTPTLTAGDSLLLKSGDTWNEELQPKGNGTSTNPILISSYGTGNQPIIDRANGNSELNGIHLIDQGGYKITNIEFAHTPTGIYGEYSATPSGGTPVTRSYVWIENCYFHDSTFYGHYENYPSPKTISVGVSFFTYEAVGTGAPDNISLKDVTVKNCVFRRMTSGIWTNNPDNFHSGSIYDNRYNFANFSFIGDLFEEGSQWQQGIRGVNGGVMRDCVTTDVGRNFTAWNGVAGSMFWRSKYWTFENSEWGCISRGGGSGDGEAFDFEGNCSHMVMRNCLFHDTDGPGFLLCETASIFHTDLRVENCVFNGKSMWSTLTRSEIFATQYDDQITWRNSRFYLSPGERLLALQYYNNPPQQEAFVNCQLKDLTYATSSPKLAGTASASSVTTGYEADKANDGSTSTAWAPATAAGEWLQLDFGTPITINEFRIKEDASSSVRRYEIQAWNDARSQWVSVFNARTIGSDFVAPIVSRTTSKVRLWITSTASGSPRISEFQAYNDPSGYTFSWPRGGASVPSYNPIPTTATSTTLASLPNPSTGGQPVTFTATVTCTAGTPTGSVDFKEGSTTLGSGMLNANGVATFTTSSLAVGTHSIVAVYAGSRYCLTSTSGAVSQVVNVGMEVAASQDAAPAGDIESETITTADAVTAATSPDASSAPAAEATPSAEDSPSSADAGATPPLVAAAPAPASPNSDTPEVAAPVLVPTTAVSQLAAAPAVSPAPTVSATAGSRAIARILGRKLPGRISSSLGQAAVAAKSAAAARISAAQTSIAAPCDQVFGNTVALNELLGCGRTGSDSGSLQEGSGDAAAARQRFYQMVREAKPGRRLGRLRF